jgi:hypothetical protein
MCNPRRLRLSPLSISGEHIVPVPVSTVRGFNSFGIKVHIPGRDAKEPTGAISRGSSWHIDLDRDADRARRAFESHLSRAKWMNEQGYRHLLRGGARSSRCPLKFQGALVPSNHSLIRNHRK